MEVNAPLKLVWKFVAALPQECQAVLAAVDATHLTAAGTYTPVTVLLTPQVCLPEGSLNCGVLEWCHEFLYCFLFYTYIPFRIAILITIFCMTISGTLHLKCGRRCSTARPSSG